MTFILMHSLQVVKGFYLCLCQVVSTFSFENTTKTTCTLIVLLVNYKEMRQMTKAMKQQHIKSPNV
jgi:hypothetical protein